MDNEKKKVFKKEIPPRKPVGKPKPPLKGYPPTPPPSPPPKKPSRPTKIPK